MESGTLGVLDMKIQCDVRWSEHTYFPGVKGSIQVFTPTDFHNIYTIYKRLKRAGASKSNLDLLDKERVKIFIGDGGVYLLGNLYLKFGFLAYDFIKSSSICG